MEDRLKLHAVSPSYGPRPSACCVESKASKVLAKVFLVASFGAVLAVDVSAQVSAQQVTPPASAAPAAPAAAPTPHAAGADTGDRIALELNKLENVSNGCRAYMVVDNKGARAYTALKLDLVMFQTDGVIGRRFALDLAPVKAGKMSVKLFDLDGVKCDDVGSLLINDIMDCKAGAGEESGCLDRLTIASRTKAQLSK